MMTIISTFFSGIRTYLEIAVVVILVGTLGFYKLEDSRLTGQLATANQKIGALTDKIEEQNTAISALKKAQQETQAAADKALEKARQTAQTEYDRAKRILATKGDTCEDAYKLILESVK